MSSLRVARMLGDETYASDRTWQNDLETDDVTKAETQLASVLHQSLCQLLLLAPYGAFLRSA